MAKVVFELEAKKRTQVGKGASRRLRREEDHVPAILYGAGKENMPITLQHKKVLKALENEAFYSHILTLVFGDEKEQVVLKDMQRHPYKKQIIHMDFQRIKADEKLHMHIPVHFIGDLMAAGVKQGGVFTKHVTEVEVRCFPADLPEYLEVDVSQLELNQILHLSDIPLPKGVEIVALLHGDKTSDVAIANIHEPRAIVEEETVAAAPVETEITGQKSEAEEPKEAEKQK